MISGALAKLVKRVTDPYDHRKRHEEHVEFVQKVSERNAVLRDLGMYRGFPITGLITSESNRGEKRG